MKESRFADSRLVLRMLRETRPYWVGIVLLFLVNLLSTPLSLLAPLPLKVAIDNVINSEPLPPILVTLLPSSMQQGTPLLLLVVLAVVAIALINGLHSMGSQVLHTVLSERMMLGFRGKLFRHTQRLSIAYHDMKGITDSTYRIQYDAPAIQRLSMDTVIPFLSSLVTLVAMIYVIARINGQLAIVALLISPPLFLLVKAYRKPLREQWRDVKRMQQNSWKVMNETLGALRVVKAFGQEDREHSRFIEHSSESIRAKIRVGVVQGSYGLLVATLSASATAAVLYIGLRDVLKGTMTLGALLVVMSYLGQLLGPLKTLGRQVTGLQNALASAERAFSVLDEAPEVLERPNARHLRRASGRFDVEGLYFHYEEGQEVLKDVSFTVAAGHKVGIAGRTGAGKTTLVNLLTRFYDPQRGRIMLDGVDIRDFRLEDYRNQFAIVLQEPVLFSTTIAENIAYGRPNASENDIVKAARMANAHEFISGLPDGYETVVGHRGQRLSGGERQRIGLARAFLKDAPVLILDEPTSSVDMATESAIIDAMDRLMSGRTTFMIAHRLTTLEQCDVLLVLEQGRLVKETSEVMETIREALEAGSLETPVTEK